MDVADPIHSVISTLDGQVLDVLSKVSGPLTGRELARLARHGSQSGLQRALNRLADQGVVEAEQHAGAIMYTLNREHLAYPAVEILTRLRAELLDRITTLIGSWDIRPEHASLFGSTARRDGDTSSDIDILLVRPEGTDEDDEAWASQVEDLRERVRRWTGNHCQPFQADRRDLNEFAKASAAITTEWIADSIRLLGPPVESYLSALPPPR